MNVEVRVENIVPHEIPKEILKEYPYSTEHHPKWRVTLVRTTTHTWWEKKWHKKEDFVEHVDVIWNGWSSSNYARMWWPDDLLKEIPTAVKLEWSTLADEFQTSVKKVVDSAVVAERWKRRQSIPVARAVHHDGPDKNCFEYGCTDDCPVNRARRA